jgi:hypothetical protein
MRKQAKNKSIHLDRIILPQKPLLHAINANSGMGRVLFYIGNALFRTKSAFKLFFGFLFAIMNFI